MDDRGGSLDPAGPVAEEMADLWWLLLVFGTVAFVVFAGALAVGLFRRRRANDEDLPTDQQTPPPGSPGLWILAGGVAMPLVLLVATFWFTLEAMLDTPNEAPEDALVIEVVGHQWWWWEIHYPEHGVTTANEVHLPVGRPVELRLVSADVIHSFWVPRLGGKLDLLPERENVLVLEADEAGTFRGQCAEFCGLQHARMGFVAVAETPERFAAWLEAQRDAADPITTATAQDGQEVFLAEGCGACHTVRGTAADGDEAPDLTHFASREMIAAATLENDRAALARSLADLDADQLRVALGLRPDALLTEEVE